MFWEENTISIHRSVDKIPWECSCIFTLMIQICIFFLTLLKDATQLQIISIKFKIFSLTLPNIVGNCLWLQFSCVIVHVLTFVMCNGLLRNRSYRGLQQSIANSVCGVYDCFTGAHKRIQIHYTLWSVVLWHAIFELHLI